MYELALVAGGFIAGGLVVAGVFLWGIKYATGLIYKIKEDIPLEKMGTPIDEDQTV